jgi:hypothetical protein
MRTHRWPGFVYALLGAGVFFSTLSDEIILRGLAGAVAVAFIGMYWVVEGDVEHLRLRETELTRALQELRAQSPTLPPG